MTLALAHPLLPTAVSALFVLTLGVAAPEWLIKQRYNPDEERDPPFVHRSQIRFVIYTGELLFLTWQAPRFVKPPFPAGMPDRAYDYLFTFLIFQLLIAWLQLVRYERAKLFAEQAPEDRTPTYRRLTLLSVLFLFCGTVLAYHFLLDVALSVAFVQLGWHLPREALLLILQRTPWSTMSQGLVSVARGVVHGAWVIIEIAFYIFVGLSGLFLIWGFVSVAHDKGHSPLLIWMIGLLIAMPLSGHLVAEKHPWAFWEFGSLFSILITNMGIDAYRLCTRKQLAKDGKHRALVDCLGSGTMRYVHSMLFFAVPAALMTMLLCLRDELTVLEQLFMFLGLYASYYISNEIAMTILDNRADETCKAASYAFKNDLHLTQISLDLPFFISYGALIIIYLSERSLRPNQTQELEAFVGGAAALKMVVQGLIFCFIVRATTPRPKNLWFLYFPPKIWWDEISARSAQTQHSNQNAPSATAPAK